MIADSPPESERCPRRRWWLAFLLSLFAPGLGHLYAGSLPQALLAVSACAIFGAMSVWLFIQPLGAFVNWGGVLLAVLTLLAIAIHAARIAPSGRPLGIRRPLRICVYVLYVVVISVASDLAKSWLRTDLYTAFRVTTAAMFPTLHVGDEFVVDKRAYAWGLPQPGDVVAFRFERLDGRMYVKRIIGVPGDRISLKAGSVYLNGNRIEGTHVCASNESGRLLQLFAQSLGENSFRIAKDPKLTLPLDLPETVVSAEQYFVLGDNRDHSSDSRYLGTVSRSAIVGKASHVYFALDPSSGSINLARIGKRVE